VTDNRITKIRARTEGSFSPGTIRVLVGVGIGHLNGGVPMDVDLESIPFEFRMPNSEYFVYYDRDILDISGYEALTENDKQA
jgi:hypothetical protein